MARLKKVDCSGPGIRRRRRGKGFEYLDDDGKRVTEPSLVERIRELAIPPAWEEVWICPYPMGHIQATGTDAAGRKQYRYHDQWRERRDAEKFERDDRVRAGAPAHAQACGDRTSRREGHAPRARAGGARCVCSTAASSGSASRITPRRTTRYGLATMRQAPRDASPATRCVRLRGEGRQAPRPVDRRPGAAPRSSRALKKRRGGGEELLAYKEGQRWVDVKSADINAYLKEAAGGDFSAKDFRTWSGDGAGGGGAGRGGRGTGVEVARKRAISARSRRSRATSATRRRSAAPRTSTRASSTASTAGSRSGARSRSSRRTPRRGPTCSVRSRRPCSI